MLRTCLLSGVAAVGLVFGGTTAVDAGGPGYGHHHGHHHHHHLRPGCGPIVAPYPPPYGYYRRVQPIYPAPVVVPGYGYPPYYGYNRGPGFGIRTDDFSFWLHR